MDDGDQDQRDAKRKAREKMRRYLRGLKRSISGKPTRDDHDLERELEEIRKTVEREE